MTRVDLLADAAGITRDQPRADGAAVGRALTALAKAGRANQPDLPEPCATCAFRTGCMTNMMPATVLAAFRCAIGQDDSPFGCHHGMTDGRPAKACAGWLAAQAADWPDVQKVNAQLQSDFEALEGQPDQVRAAFLDWIGRVDPDGRLDDYERGRLWLRDHGVRP